MNEKKEKRCDVNTLYINEGQRSTTSVKPASQVETHWFSHSLSLSLSLTLSLSLCLTLSQA
jgi:hypothetical protein